jgi:cytochrome c
MSNLFFNKIAAAVLATGLGFMGLKEISHMAFHTSELDTPAYSVGPTEVESSDGADEPLPFPQPSWVDAMDAERGAKVFKKCTSCHNADIGGANGTGPNLYNIVGAPAGGKDGFAYSEVMSNSGVTWDYEALDGFLAKPAKYMKGTKMAFIGVKKEGDRAAVIEYLRVAADNPADRPAPMIDGSNPVSEVIENISEAPSSVDKAAQDIIETVIETSDGIETQATDLMDQAKDAAEDLKEKIPADAGEQ